MDNILLLTFEMWLMGSLFGYSSRTDSVTSIKNDFHRRMLLALLLPAVLLGFFLLSVVPMLDSVVNAFKLYAYAWRSTPKEFIQVYDIDTLAPTKCPRCHRFFAQYARRASLVCECEEKTE